MATKGGDRLASYIVDDLFRWFQNERQSLLEPQWRANYDAFRGDYDSESLRKWKSTEGTSWRSSVFVRLTKQKVVSGYNSVLSLLLHQGGMIPWDIKPTTIPEQLPGMEMLRQDADKRAEAMKRKIKDNLDECQAERHFMSIVLSMALYGIGWCRGPVLRPFRSARVQFQPPPVPGAIPPEMLARYGKHALVIAEATRPVMEYLDPWKVFWDLETPDHQEGFGVIVREKMSPARFRELADLPGYSKKAIEQVLSQTTEDDEGDRNIGSDDSEGPAQDKLSERRRTVSVYEFFGRVPRSVLGVGDSGSEEIRAVCAAVSYPVTIRSPRPALVPARPIYRANWENLLDEACGVGIPENIQDSQMMVNSLTRSMLDNKALASNLMVWWNAEKMAPGQNKIFYPGKVFETAEGVEDVRQALQFFSPPDNSGNTISIINMFERWADQESGLPQILQGETARNQPDTAYEMSQLVEGANKTIGATIRNLDEGIIEPMIKGFYHYHMLTSDDESIKGDYSIVPKGFQTYQDKAVRGQKLLTLMKFAASVQALAAGTKFMEGLREVARTMDLDPDTLFMTNTEMEQQAQAMAQQAPAPPGVQGPPPAGLRGMAA